MKNTSVLDIYGWTRITDIVNNYNITSQDYFIHVLRFSKMCELLRNKNIIDLGCGKYANLLKAITQMSRGPMFSHYVGIDYGPITEFRPNYAPIANKVDYFEMADWTNDETYTVIRNELAKIYSNGESVYVVCFEVLEHMDFDSQKKFLYNLSKLMHDKDLNIAACYFSTPNHNGNPAKNHISEINFLLEEEMFKRYDLKVISAQGLSAWKKYHNISSGGTQDKLTTDLLNKLTADLPDPLNKMIWGDILHRKYSNNIMYTLEAGNEEIKPYDIYGAPFEFDGYRQGGKYQLMCGNPDASVFDVM